MNDTSFDPELFKLPPEMAAELAKAKPKRSGKQPKRTEPFLQIPHKALVAGSTVLRGPKQFLVWLYIHHRVCSDKRNTVTIANTMLESWGVGRKEKAKALRLLEKAGLVSVQWFDRRSPQVTLLAGR